MCGCCGDKSDEEKTDLTTRATSRGCTDILVLLVFILFWAGMIYIAVFGIMHGDAFRLVYGYDSFGNTCDSDNTNRAVPNVTLSGKNMKGRPFVFFMDVENPFKSKCICVNECPKDELTTKKQVQSFSHYIGSELCEYDIKVEDYLKQNYSIKGPCPKLPVPASQPLLHFCIPMDLSVFAYKESIIGYLNTRDIFHKVLSDLINGWREMMLLCLCALGITVPSSGDCWNKGPPLIKPLLNRCVPANLLERATNVSTVIINYLNTSDVFQKVLSDLYTCWKEMLILCFIAVGFSGLMVLLIRFLASVIVWVILTVAIIASIVGTGFLWWTYVDIKNEIERDEAINLPLLDVEINSERAFLIYSIIATVLTVILLLVILVMRKRISLVVTLFHEAGKCISSVPCLLLQPVYTFVILIGFFMYWVIVLAFLSTSEIASRDEEGYVKYTEHETVSYMWWYHLIGLIWTSEFIIACQQLVICGAVATWYFSRTKEDLGCPIVSSMKLLVFHHLGSVAFGALIITAVKLPRMILMYLHKKMKGSENQCAKYCMKCCICCLWCLEKCLKYLNQNAYTVIAIQGTNFCTSAAKSFTTLVSNALRVAAINSVGDFILFLGKIGVMAATAAVGILWFKSREDLHYYAVPVLLVCVFAYLIASSFLSTYEMVIDAMLLCFCHDCDINDGSAERPYYASESLQSFIDGTSKSLNRLNRESGTEEETEPARL